MRPILYVTLPLLLAAALARGDVRASLPLHGYSRPGYFIPVRLEGTTTATAVEITGDGVNPTRVAVSGGALNVVVPVLTTASADDMVVRELAGGKPIPIQPVGNRMFDGGVLSRQRVLVGNATSQRVLHIVAVSNDISLDPTDPVPGPAMAWEALDYLVVEPPGAARIGDAKLLNLLAEGVTILQLDEKPPLGSLPWVHAPGIVGRHDAWMLDPELRGVRGSVFEHALRPVGGTEAGSSPAARRNVLLAGVLFTILATGVSLLLPWRRPALAAGATGSLVLLTLGGVHVWWTRQPPALPTVGGWIIVEQPPFTQVDTWIYYSPARGTTFNLPADLRPITESIDALARLRPTLRCAADGTPVGFSCSGPTGHLAVLARNVVLGEPATPNLEPRVTSPLLPMVQRGYLQPGSRRVAVVGQAPSEAWPTVVIRTVDSTPGTATRAVE